jgi:protein-S-isoprenylcysteine O-methyltransferase Ste14
MQMLGRAPSAICRGIIVEIVEHILVGRYPPAWSPPPCAAMNMVTAWTGNPMYLGMALIYAGLAIGADGPIAFALLPLVLIVIQTQVIAREERYLEAKFGEDYRRYKANVRRWL